MKYTEHRLTPGMVALLRRMGGERNVPLPRGYAMSQRGLEQRGLIEHELTKRGIWRWVLTDAGRDVLTQISAEAEA